MISGEARGWEGGDWNRGDADFEIYMHTVNTVDFILYFIQNAVDTMDFIFYFVQNEKSM